MHTGDTTALARAIRSIRKALRATQEELALAAGTNRRFIVDLEKGKGTVQLAKVMNVLRALGVTVDLLMPPGVSVTDGDAP